MIRDIKKLKLEMMTQAILDEFEQEKDATVSLSVRAMRNRHNARVASAVSMAYGMGEAGSDGIEEGLAEQGMEFDAEAAEAEALKKIDTVTMFRNTQAEVVSRFILEWKLYNELDWLFPQLMAHIASNWKLTYGEDGKITRDFLKCTNPKEFPFDYAVRALATADRRLFFQTGSKGTRAPLPHYKSKWNLYVPIIMAAYKQLADVPYSSWNEETAKLVCHPDLAQFIGNPLPELTVQERLKLRTEATTVLSTGRLGSPEYSYKLNGEIKSYATTEKSSLDALRLHAIIQTWCMHPTNWTPLMIKDPVAWDSEPERLISAAIMKHKFGSPETGRSSSTDFPWDV